MCIFIYIYIYIYILVSFTGKLETWHSAQNWDLQQTYVDFIVAVAVVASTVVSAFGVTCKYVCMCILFSFSFLLLLLSYADHSYTDNSHVNNICTDNGYANNNHTDGILTFAIHLCSNIWPWACKLGGRYIYSHGRESSALVSSSCSIPPTWHERLRQWLPQLICFSRRWRRQQSVAWDRAF